MTIDQWSRSFGSPSKDELESGKIIDISNWLYDDSFDKVSLPKENDFNLDSFDFNTIMKTLGCSAHKFCFNKIQGSENKFKTKLKIVKIMIQITDKNDTFIARRLDRLKYHSKLYASKSNLDAKRCREQCKHYRHGFCSNIHACKLIHSKLPCKFFEWDKKKDNEICGQSKIVGDNRLRKSKETVCRKQDGLKSMDHGSYKNTMNFDSNFDQKTEKIEKPGSMADLNWLIESKSVTVDNPVIDYSIIYKAHQAKAQGSGTNPLLRDPRLFKFFASLKGPDFSSLEKTKEEVVVASSTIKNCLRPPSCGWQRETDLRRKPEPSSIFEIIPMEAKALSAVNTPKNLVDLAESSVFNSDEDVDKLYIDVDYVRDSDKDDE